MATQKKIGWKTQKGDTVYQGEFEVPTPETAQEAIEMFGEENVRLGFIKSRDIYIQAWARREATKEEDPMSAADIAAKAAHIKIEFSEREFTDPVQKYLEGFGKLSAEAKAKLLGSLKEMLAGGEEAA